MATYEAGARLHRAMLAGRPSHMVPRHIAASAGCSLLPMPWYVTVPLGTSPRRAGGEDR
jgi:hypothetical protein